MYTDAVCALVVRLTVPDVPLGKELAQHKVLEHNEEPVRVAWAESCFEARFSNLEVRCDLEVRCELCAEPLSQTLGVAYTLMRSAQLVVILIAPDVLGV